jgi:tRNA-splicing ligase RtcB
MSRKKRKKRERKQHRRDRKKAERVDVALAPAPYKGRVPLQQIDSCRWRVPKTGAMNVDGVVYADEALMPDLREDKCLEQVANVATLPGIVGHSLAMPDIHWGYGFPIGGVAAFDPDGGVVSPGGVGYDINCLHGDARVLHRYGYWRTIERIVRDEVRDPVVLKGKGALRTAPIAAGFGQKPRRPALELRTAAGRTVVATADHPFLREDGMTQTGALEVGDRLAVSPFTGVPFEAPSSRVIVSADDVRRAAERLGKTNAGNGISQALRKLAPLLPLTFDHEALPVLLKVAGYVLGDGAVYWEKATKKGRVVAYGKRQDLEAMAADLAPWFKASTVYSRTRSCRTQTTYGDHTFEATEHSVRLGSTAFVLLLAAMGLPVGRRTDQDWSLPPWLQFAPRWQQRLFLAGYFGAELSTPTPVPSQGTCFQCPLLCLNKREGFVESGETFLRQVAGLLDGFGVRTLKVSDRPEQRNPDGSLSTRLLLVLSSETESLLALWSAVGYEYNAERSRLGALAAGYLRAKAAAHAQREGARQRVLALRARHGWGAKRIKAAIGGPEAPVNLRFVERTIYGGANREVRTAERFPRFEEWRATATDGLPDGLVWETVESIRPAQAEFVYDLTVDDDEHNFVANGFVVHNCGVRLLAADAAVGDVKGRITPLTEALFRAIPAGVGSARKDLALGADGLEGVLAKGLGWALDEGLASEEDVERVEENGFIPSDPAQVSDRARKRGLNQVGTLGSGNHFAEIGYVDEVYDAESAEAFGLREGQITLMIHSGSRGLGHQVCTDFLQTMLRASTKYGIPLVDRQLCCAPIGSDEATRYLGAMAAAANFAFVNRQVMTHWARQVFKKELSAKLRTVYDVCHNIAKYEEHVVDGVARRLLVHRKGATRALPAGHALLPESYRPLGQPVIIPGDMGRYSYVLKGALGSDETFGSACHGAGRLLSRSEAKRRYGSENVTKQLADQGVIVRGASKATVVEEVPNAYKDVAEVVHVVHDAGIAAKVARIRPLGCVKG